MEVGLLGASEAVPGAGPLQQGSRGGQLWLQCSAGYWREESGAGLCAVVAMNLLYDLEV